jgi:two-component system cell cycle sensor histidine kinase/response regulator CckA
MTGVPRKAYGSTKPFETAFFPGWLMATPDDPAGVSGLLHILVVDDTSVVRRGTARMLSEEGFRVFEAGSAVEAIEVLRTSRKRIDLVIADVVMPGINGVDLVRLIHAEWPQTPIIFMSAYQAEELVRQGLERPAVIFLAKPFTRDELMQRIREALGGRRKRNGQESSSQRPAT